MTPPQSTSTMVSNIRPNATTTTTTTNNNTTTNHANNHNEREKLGYEPAEPSRRFKTEDFSVNSDQESRSDLELNHNSNQDMASLSSHSGRSLSQQQQSQAARDEFVQSDTRNVRRARWIVYGTLVVVALGVGLATYYLSQQQQQQQEEASTSSFSEWEDLLTHHIESVIHQTFQDEMIPQLHRTSKLLTSEGLLRLEDSTTTTTATTATTTATSVWPEVTLKHFDLLINTNNGNGNGNFDLLAYAPIVWNTSRWEAYTNATVYPMKSRQPVLPDFRPLYSAPLWQVSSPTTTTTTSSSSNRSIINMDLASHPIMYQLLQDVDANDDDDDDDDDTTTSMAISSLLNPMIQTQFFLNDNDDDHGPQSILAVPIHENFSSNSNNIVGFVLGIFSWNTILEAAVEAFLDEPHYIDHLHVVLQESCGSKDNNLVLPLLGKQQEDDSLISGQTATFQVLISSARCHYSMTLGFVESSSSSGSGSGSGEKAYAFLAAALVFGMVGSVYAYYDCLVQRRHKNLSVIAQRTASMLSSLFPKDVQRRIMAEAEQKENTTPLRGLMNRPNRRLSVTGKMTEFLDDNPNKNNNNNSRDTSKNSSNSGFQTKPIADLFPEATIVFADLVGFTAWSSMREPCQVL